MTDQTGSPPSPRLDALGANHILAAAARMIHRWHGDPNLDCQAEAQKIIDESAKVHFALVEIGQQSEAQSLSGEREGLDVRDALAAISDIRDSIIGHQSINWSLHIYPLVAALGAAGFRGRGYDDAKAAIEDIDSRILERQERDNARLASLPTEGGER